ncbi:MAG: redoxin domain-containing protein [Planctomycetota bacterium]|jgi:peroxiredoxin
MKRYLILTVIALVVLAASWAAFAQREGTEGSRSRSPEERAKLRERWQNMSEEEREKSRAQMRNRQAQRREDELKAIKAIEEQIPKLKAGSEASGAFSRWRELSDEERTKLRETFAKARQERQNAIKAIIAQIARLQGRRQPTAEGEEFILINTGTLKDIRKLAEKEKAAETAQRLERLITGRRPRRQRPGTSRTEQPVRRPTIVEPEDARKAQEFTLNTFDGKEISLSDYRGKTVVLEWFNFECPYVMHHYRRETNTMVGLANKYKNSNVVWLTVNSTSHTTPAANKEFTQKYKLPFPILDDRSGKVGRAYGAKTTPHMYIITPRGNIVYEGAIDNSPLGNKKEGAINYVDKALAELTAGKAVTTSNTKPYGCSVKYP